MSYKDLEKNNEAVKRYHRNLREAGIYALGSVCECCLEHRYEFLAFDHVQGGEARARRNSISTHMWLADLKRRGWPTDEVRLLCHNCNTALGSYGRCPHADEEN